MSPPLSLMVKRSLPARNIQVRKNTSSFTLPTYLPTGKAKGLRALASLELEGEDTHADEVSPVDTLEALSDDGLDSHKVGALGGPVTGGARAVLLASKHDGVDVGLLVALGCVVDGEGLTSGDVDGLGAFRGEGKLK
jgi:hypothetical protein